MAIPGKALAIDIVIGISLVIFLLEAAVAEPYLAVRYGQKCSSCHTNITGGGKRTTAGNAYATGLTNAPLSTRYSPQLNENISVGGNFRGDFSYTQFPDAELSDGDSSAPIVAEDSSAFNVSNGALYLEFAVADKLLFYLDQQVAPEGGRTREALILYRGIAGKDTYLKAGRFYLPYGWRLQDDQAFIRQSTGFNFDNSDTGVEFGWEPKNWSFSAALSNGTQGAGENNTDKQFSFTAAFVEPVFRLGVSFSVNNAPNDISSNLANIYGGMNLGKFALLGEVDLIENEIGDLKTTQYAGFFSANYLIQPALNLKLSHEYFDPNDDIEENEQTRTSIIGEYFVNQFFQLRAGARLYDGIPQNPIENRDIGFFELHIFY